MTFKIHKSIPEFRWVKLRRTRYAYPDWFPRFTPPFEIGACGSKSLTWLSRTIFSSWTEVRGIHSPPVSGHHGTTMCCTAGRSCIQVFFRWLLSMAHFPYSLPLQLFVIGFKVSIERGLLRCSVLDVSVQLWAKERVQWPVFFIVLYDMNVITLVT